MTDIKTKLLGVKAQCPEGHLIIDLDPYFFAEQTWDDRCIISIDVHCEACNKDYEIFNA